MVYGVGRFEKDRILLTAGIEIRAISKQGKVTDDILMLDVQGWNYQKTTSTYLLLGEQIAIIEPANRSSAKRILEGIKDFNISPNLIHHIFVSHRHFDHSAGAPPLLEHLPNAKIKAHQYAIENFKNPEKINKAAKQIYGEFAEPIDRIKEEEKLNTVKEGDLTDLGNGLEVEVIHTPGHTSDHFAYYERKNKFMFVGDAAGLFGSETHSIIPTAFPPSFKYKNYVESIEKMLGYDVRVIAFAHFGAVKGSDASEILEKSLETTEECKNLAEEKWKIDNSIDELANVLKNKYQNKLEVFPKKLRDDIYPILAMGLVNSLFEK